MVRKTNKTDFGTWGEDGVAGAGDPGRDPSAAADDLVAVADGLRRLTLTLEQLRHRYGEIAGVGYTDVMALGNLYADGPLSAADLATRLGITRSSVTALMDRLEAAGLVERRADPGDRRRLRLTLTAQGREAVQRARGWSLEALGDIEPDRLPMMARALDQVAEALKRHDANS